MIRPDYWQRSDDHGISDYGSGAIEKLAVAPPQICLAAKTRPNLAAPSVCLAPYVQRMCRPVRRDLPGSQPATRAQGRSFSVPPLVVRSSWSATCTLRDRRYMHGRARSGGNLVSLDELRAFARGPE